MGGHPYELVFNTLTGEVLVLHVIGESEED